MNKSRILMLLACLLLCVGTVIACDCKPASDPNYSLKRAEAVFSGKVIKIEYLDDQKQVGIEPRILVTLRVYKVWKGGLTKTITLQTVYNKASCDGYSFKQDEEYLTFAYANDSEKVKIFPKTKNSLGVRLCGGTRRLKDVHTSFMNNLGAGKSIL